MTKSMIELTTERAQQAALAEPRPPKTVDIIRKDGRYCLDAFGRYWTLPARWDPLWRWLRGRRVWVIRLILLAFGILVGWILSRLFFGARR